MMEHLQESTNVVKSNQKLLRAIILNIIVVILLVTLGMFLPSKSYYLVMILLSCYCEFIIVALSND